MERLKRRAMTDRDDGGRRHTVASVERMLFTDYRLLQEGFKGLKKWEN
jgi:hypothetical protein